jgi:hypothetical protein
MNMPTTEALPLRPEKFKEVTSNPSVAAAATFVQLDSATCSHGGVGKCTADKSESWQ